MPNIGATELIILLVVVMLLFGAKRLPDSARALGRSMRILKAETKGLRDDDRDTTVTAEPLPPVQQQHGQQPAQPPYGQQQYAQPQQGQPQYGQPAPGQAPPAPEAPGTGEQAPRA